MSVINTQPLAGASGSQATGYNLTKSLRFRASANAHLTRTQVAGNRQKYTYSVWVKYSVNDNGVYNSPIFVSDNGSSTDAIMFEQSPNTLHRLQFYAGDGYYETTQLFRDPASWYHIVLAVDTTQSVNSDRIKAYVNGTRITSFVTANPPTLNTNLSVNQSGTVAYIGKQWTYARYFDGYQTEIHMVDGQQLDASLFGETDSITGVWKSKRYTGTYGTNGFYLPFTDVALTSGSNAGLGKDFSGNGNYWTTNNISVTAGSTYDSMTDVPTLTSATTANYAVLNPLLNSPVLTNGNLQLGYNSQWAASTLGVTTGKFYFEATILSQNTYNLDVGVVNQNHSGSVVGASANSWGIIVQSNSNNGDLWNNGTTVASGVTFTTNDVVNVAFDIDAGKIWFGKNGTWVQSGNPATAANPQYTNLSGTIFGAGSSYQNSGGSLAFNFGQQGFKYTPPTGYVALNTYNLPTSTIVKGNTVMDATLYTANNSTQTITNAGGFKPDFVWEKSRANAYSHQIFDSVRGVGKYLYTDQTAAEGTNAASLTSFNSNGYSVGATGNANLTNGTASVGWQWQAGQGTTSSNTNGSITSTVSVNPTAGFSIVTWAGNGGASATIGHGLGVAPQFIIVKDRSATSSWIVQHNSLGWTQGFLGISTVAATTSSAFSNNTAPSSTVFTTAAYSNNNGDNYVAYCWAEIAGFSKFGSYTGNGSTDGPFIYTGFRPKWIMVKNSSAGGKWVLMDTSRGLYNEMTGSNALYPNTSDAEGTDSANRQMDFLSNGFKLRCTGGDANGSGNTIIYAAFAENPFKNSLAR